MFSVADPLSVIVTTVDVASVLDPSRAAVTVTSVCPAPSPMVAGSTESVIEAGASSSSVMVVVTDDAPSAGVPPPPPEGLDRATLKVSSSSESVSSVVRTVKDLSAWSARVNVSVPDAAA